jgi:hypothetical protein
MIDTDLHAKNLDLSSPRGLSFRAYLRPLWCIAQFLGQFPVEFDDQNFLPAFSKRIMRVLPTQGCMLALRLWRKLSERDRVKMVKHGAAAVAFTQDHQIPAVLCVLFMTLPAHLRAALAESEGQLAAAARFALTHREGVSSEQQAIFECFETLGRFITPDIHALAFKIPEITPCHFRDVHFRFEAITISELSNFDPHHFLTQLRYRTCHFSTEQLQHFFDEFSESSDTSAVTRVLKYATEHLVAVQVDHTVVAPDAVPAVIDHLQSLGSAELPEFLRHFSPSVERRLILSAVIGADPGGYLTGLMAKRTLTKRDLETFAIAASTVVFDPELLQISVLRLFESAHTHRKMQRVLAGIANVLSVVKKFTDTFIDSVIQFFRSARRELMAEQVARCFLLFVSAVPQVHYRQTYLPFLRAVHPISLEGVLLYLSLAWVNPDGVFHSDAPSVACKLFAMGVPSFFCLGLRLFERSLSCLPERRLSWLFRHGFDDLAASFARFSPLFPVAEAAGSSWVAILSNPDLKAFCPFLLQNALRIVPDPSRAAFPATSVCLPQVIEATAGQDAYADVTKQLSAKSTVFLTAPPSIVLARLFVRLMAVQAGLLSTVEKRQTFMMNWFRDWIEKHFPQGDCYAVSEIVFDVCAAVLRVNGFAELLPFVTTEFFSRAPRFFPVFVGIAKFVRARMWKQYAEQRDKLVAALTDAGNAMQCRAHGCAIRIIAEVGMGKVALDLALFPADCEESDRIIERIVSG